MTELMRRYDITAWVHATLQQDEAMEQELDYLTPAELWIVVEAAERMANFSRRLIFAKLAHGKKAHPA